MKILPKSKRAFVEIVIVLAFTFIFNQVVYTGTKFITDSWYNYNMTVSLDNMIPFLSWTVIIYFIAFPFWGANYYLCANQDPLERDRFFCADILSKVFCLIIFLILPTTNVRPDITNGEGFFNYIMKFLYWIDTPQNLFPSIHCIASWLCFIGLRKRKDIPFIYKFITLVIAVSICISTLTTKQHVIVDVFSGIFLAELCYFLSGFSVIRNVYSKIINFLFKLFRTDRIGNKAEKEKESET